MSELQEKILTELLVSPSGALSADQLNDVMAELKIPQREQRLFMRDIRNDTSLAQFNEDGSLEINFSVGGLIAAVTPCLSEHIARRGCHCREDVWSVSRNARSSNESERTRMVYEIGDINMIVADESTSFSRLKLLRDHLDASRFRIETMPSETGAPFAPGASLVARDSNVLIYSDIILSAETVRRCLGQILRDEGLPLAVLCLFDARAIDEPIEMWGINVPVVSLAKLDMSIATKGSFSNINPITREIEGSSVENILLPKIGEEQLADMLRATNALHFSHVGRPIGRHFTFYLDAGRLLGDSRVVEAFHAVVDEWLSGLAVEGHLVREIELWNATPEPKPPFFASGLGKWIQQQRPDIKFRRTIRRETAYGRWTFVRDPAIYVNCPNVLIVDWGSLTGSSVMQMVRLAAEAGASNVLSCVFVRQLPIDDQAVLESIRKVEVRGGGFGSRSQLPLPGLDWRVSRPKRSVSVSITFLSSLPIGVYDKSECPVCQQLARLAQEVYPTALLRDFSRFQREEALRPRTREEIAISNPKDFYGREIDSGSTVWMVGLRQRLSAALISTTDRLRILEELLSLARDAKGPITKRKVFDFLHFLSVEGHWLRRAPLSFRELRKLVAEIALTVAVDTDLSEFDRLNAIIVLRSSSKYTFARHFTTLFRVVGESRLLRRQIVYDVFTYLARPYHQTIEVLRPLEAGLKQLYDWTASGALRVDDDVYETIESLFFRVETEFARASFRYLTPVKAWEHLRRVFGFSYTKRHNSVVKNMDHVLPGPDAIPIEESLAQHESTKSEPSALESGPNSYLRSLHAHWEPCRKFLDYTVFPVLRHLKEILVSEDGRRALGSDTAGRLVELIDMPYSLAEDDFSRLVRDISRDPELVFFPRTWERTKSEILWYWEEIFRPGGEVERQSKLIEFLKSAPIDLGPSFAAAMDGIRRKIPNVAVEGVDDLIKSGRFVFCMEQLAIDLFEEILYNCEKHRNRGKDGGHVILRVGISSEDHDYIVLNFKNNNSIEEAVPGEGLKNLERRLEAFGTELRTTSRVGDGWATFQIEIDLIRMEPPYREDML